MRELLLQAVNKTCDFGNKVVETAKTGWDSLETKKVADDNKLVISCIKRSLQDLADNKISQNTAIKEITLLVEAAHE